MSVKVINISKTFESQKALDKVSFEIEKGEIVGFLGPNGAGKSTLMKIITGYTKASEGEIFICESNIETDRINAQRKIGYLPENNPLYLEMYVKEYLNFCASIHNTSKVEVESVMNKVGLLPESHKKIKQLSKGYKQRVGIAAALQHNPDVLILDEPTTGLDPNQLLEIRNLIKEVGKDKTVLFSTHIMQEVEAICDRVILINKGKIIADKKISELKDDENQIIEVEFDYKIEKQFFESLPNLKSVENTIDNEWVLHFSTDKDMRTKVFDFAHANGLKIVQLNTKNKNLESLFRDLTTL